MAGQAYAQRGLIRRLRGEENEAFEDFQKASVLGNTFAKHLCAQMNPYAKLCNQMLKQAFTKLQDL